ncbi:hypothetical protein like AT4G33800 [Hibiscus trionum]|uniref:Uncharacterized protein n=1 Tax=Hibiscus trionum TaxID=183268 RepID=A0A9W7HMA7_HIBTR|nr:hypothetical protein like AT4G33800 [Hibiscus trionum]
MNLSASQCGSGCESGWTFYLDQSFCSQTWSGFESGVNGARFGGEDEEEDLSMVSDASSGPRQYYCQEKPVKKNSRNKKMIKEHCGNNQQHSCLDDTASSPLINFPEKKFNEEGSIELSDFSQGFSGTHFKGKTAFQKSGKTSYKHAGAFQERSRE